MPVFLRTILLISVELSAIIYNNVSADECHGYENCRECIRQPQCNWCSQKDFQDEKRCFNPNGNDTDVTLCDDVTDLKGRVDIVKNGTLGSSYDERVDSDLKEGEVPRLIQITPLVVNLKLRPNEEQSTRVTFQQSKDYPLDLYYLVDSSGSMGPHIQQVVKVGGKISKTMRSITKNFRLGCGTFVDKPLRPFNYYYEGCEQKEGVCKKSGKNMFEFQHLLKLEANSELFRSKMDAIKVRFNVDWIEGGLTALMQVLACKHDIGWRDNSHRLVIYTSDADYHQAGDGKIAGIVIPNDGQCHLDADGFYTHSALQDYPSVSHINYMASKQNIIIIFAIHGHHSRKTYDNLSKHIKGASFAALTNNASQIVEIIENEYKQITSYVELNDNSSSLIDVMYKTKCLNGDQLVYTHRCNGLVIGSKVDFDVTFTLRECPADGQTRKETFEIRPTGMNESVIVNVEMICECPCEKEGIERNSTKCNNGGDYKCGICDCDDDHIGWKCECLKGREKDDQSNKCLRPTNTTENAVLECSGNGHCKCGKCYCYDSEYISGTYCECDKRSCRQKNNKPCSGNGKCECGECKCYSGWSHSSPDNPVCDCFESDDSCYMNTNSKIICSGHGDCVCGGCVCEEGFVGQYCQVPPRHYKLCRQIESCVECLAYGTGDKFQPEKKTNCSDDCSFEVSLGIENRDDDSIQCYSEDVNGCTYQFFYCYEDMQLKILAQQEKPQCEEINYLLYITTTTGIGLLVGILALIAWKLITMTYDRLEYIKFMKEQERAKWDSAGNPLYKAPTMTVQNPMFHAQS